jgi:signal transduction histidine kinase
MGPEEFLAQRGLSLSGEVVVVLAPDGRILAVNRAAAEVLGWPPGASLDDLLPAYERARVREDVRAVAAGKRTFHFVNAVIAADGSEPLFRWNAYAAEIDGQTAVVALGEAVADGGMDETMAGQTRFLLPQLLANSSEGVALLDRDGRVLCHNRALALAFGARTHMDVLELVSPADRPAVRDLLTRAGRHEATPRDVAARLQGAEGPIGVKLRVVPFDLEGVTALHLIVRPDDREASDAELRRVLRSTISREAVAQVVHDARNYIMLVRLGVEELSGKGNKDLRREIDYGLNRVRELLESLVRAPSAYTATCQPSEVVRRCVPLFERLVMPQRLSTTISSDVPEVRLSGPELEQILMNLLVNARDAMQDGQRGTIEIVVGRDETDGVPQATLLVRDPGAGIPEALRDRIFEPFFTTKGAGGSGLGLAIVRRLVQAAGGTIHVESAVGAGTTFRVRMPAVRG